MEAFFFQARPESLPLYVMLRDAVLQRWPETVIEVKKTQITFREKRGYAFVSLPRRKKDVGIVVTFGLGERLIHPRIACSTEVYPGRWTHHVPVACAEEVDRELLGWIGQACLFCRGKK